MRLMRIEVEDEKGDTMPYRTPALAGGVLGAEDQVDRPRRGPCQVSQRR